MILIQFPVITHAQCDEILVFKWERGKNSARQDFKNNIEAMEIDDIFKEPKSFNNDFERVLVISQDIISRKAEKFQVVHISGKTLLGLEAFRDVCCVGKELFEKTLLKGRGANCPKKCNEIC